MVCKGEAADVLNAEGELQSLARFYQKKRTDEAFNLLEGEETPETVDAVLGTGDEREKESEVEEIKELVDSKSF